MIVYRTRHTGIHAHDNGLAYTSRPANAPETEIVAFDLDLPGYSAGGPEDDTSMVFDASGHGYAMTYDKRNRTVLLHDYAGRLIQAVSAQTAETILD